MWSLADINGEPFLYNCEIENGAIKYLFCDLKKIWREICNVKDVLCRAREMNKRIEYDQETILETIKLKPELLTIEVPVGEEKDQVNIKTKYSIDGLPFNFTWKTILLPQEEFAKLVTKPLLLTLTLLSQQNQALKEIIRKKDVEIEQFRIEGAILKRSKVATELFDEAVFDSKYIKIKTDDFLQYATKEFENLKNDCVDILEEPVPIISRVTTPVNSTSRLSKAPGRSKHTKYDKRKKHQQLLLQIGKVRYDDSDSCTPPECDNEVEGIKKSLAELKRKQQESLNESASQSIATVTKRSKRKFNL